MINNETEARFGSGHAVRRLEDEALLKGQGQFTDDLGEEADGHLVFLRSPYAHARVLGVNAEAARSMPGVRIVLTGEDFADAPTLPVGASFKRADGSKCATPERPVLARDTVRFVGEPLVAIVADTLEQARDAAEAVLVDYDELPVVPTLAAALTGAATVCSAAPDNIACEARHGDVAAAAAAFEGAAHRIKLDIVHQRLVALTLEPGPFAPSGTWKRGAWTCISVRRCPLQFEARSAASWGWKPSRLESALETWAVDSG